MSKIYVDAIDKEKLIRALNKSFRYNENNEKKMKVLCTKNEFNIPVIVLIKVLSVDDYIGFTINYSAKHVNIDNNYFNFDFNSRRL